MDEYVGITFFLILLLGLIGLVSVHYRKKYEELKIVLEEIIENEKD